MIDVTTLTVESEPAYRDFVARTPGALVYHSLAYRDLLKEHLGCHDEYLVGDGLCTHAKVHLADGALVDGQIECPKHNGRFDARTGEVTRKPPRDALVMYPVRRVSGRLVSDLEPRPAPVLQEQ